MQSSFTPGPWRTKREGFSTVYVEARIDGGLIQEVAACGPTEAGLEQQEANARLIAAAPELLEALQAVLRSFPTDRDMRDAGWERAEIDMACRDYEAARAAISKALPNAAAKEAGK